MSKIQVYSKTTEGKGKKENQDTCFVQKNNYQEIILGVADGVGSYSKSKLISTKVATILKTQFLEKKFAPLNKQEIKKWCQNIIEKVISKEVRKIHEKVATTLSFIILCHQQGYFCHIGNTRIYQFNYQKQQLLKLTEDHNFESETEDTFSWMKGKKFLKNAISNYKNCYFDFGEIEINSGYLLLSSDGLHDFIDHNFIAQILKNQQLEEEKIEMLFDKALFSGSLDDITCLLVKIN